MKSILPHTLKGKIIVATVFCIIIVGVPSNLMLYTYLNRIINEKVATLDTMWLESAQEEIQTVLDKANLMASWCSYNEDVRTALNYSSFSPDMVLDDAPTDNRDAVLAAIAAQATVTTYLDASGIDTYVRKLVIFNDRDMTFQASTRNWGVISDLINIRNSSAFKKARRNQTSIVSTIPGYSIVDGMPCICVISPAGTDGWVYIELDVSMFNPLLRPYSDYVNNYVITLDGWSYPILGRPVQSLLEDGGGYQATSVALENGGLYIVSRTNLKILKQSNRYGIYISLAVCATSLLIACALAFFLTNITTKPVRVLIDHIKTTTETNDFSPDPEIEQGEDEIAAIGKTVNDMSRSISSLLEKNEQLFEQRKNAEITALQTQVNPHFLYNTLESIHWMAVVQKAPGIASMARGLSNLLKNLAKGQGDHIPLSEELKLLNDYQAIQQVRYMGMFELDDEIPEELKKYKIVKFTLQPLVENAIFHGIEPTGRIGTITLTAKADDTYLYITVEDDGIGMSEEEIQSTMSTPQALKGSTLTGVGVHNVDERLKLTYGEECGLSIESEKDRFTRVTVKLRLEE